MKTTYIAHSPRGFSNEVNIFAVATAEADDWLAWFNDNIGDAYHEAYVITRCDALKRLRREGVSLAGSFAARYDREPGESPLSARLVADARLNARNFRAEWERGRELYAVVAAE